MDSCIHAGRRDGWSFISISLHSDIQAFTGRKYIATQEWERWNGVMTLWVSGSRRWRTQETWALKHQWTITLRCRQIQVRCRSQACFWHMHWFASCRNPKNMQNHARRPKVACGTHLAHLLSFQRADLNYDLPERSACKAPPSQTWTIAWHISLIQ